MPVSEVINAGIGMSGLTRVWNFSVITPRSTRNAPISVTRHGGAFAPVVSRSKTTNLFREGGEHRSHSGPTQWCHRRVSDTRISIAKVLNQQPSDRRLRLSNVHYVIDDLTRGSARPPNIRSMAIVSLISKESETRLRLGSISGFILSVIL